MSKQCGMPSGTHGQDEMADLIAQLVDNERKAAERVLQLHRECEVAEAWIDTLPEQQRRVMRAYYIDGAKSWLEVADLPPVIMQQGEVVRFAQTAKP